MRTSKDFGCIINADRSRNRFAPKNHVFNKEIKLDWYNDFGITVYNSVRPYEEEIGATRMVTDLEPIKRFEHKEYAFKFSSHELNGIDLKKALTDLEKLLFLEWWGLSATNRLLDPVRFNGRVKPFDIKRFYFQQHFPGIDMLIERKVEYEKNNYEMPVFFSRIPYWDLRIKPKVLWYPDTGYAEEYDFETNKMRKPTEDEIVNNASLYTRFSTGFV